MKRAFLFLIYSVFIVLMVYFFIPKSIYHKKTALTEYMVLQYEESAPNLPTEALNNKKGSIGLDTGFDCVRTQNSEPIFEENDQNTNITSVNTEVDKKDTKENKKINENVIGVLEIPKIKAKYPIIAETTKETLKISVTAYAGNIHGVGNFVIAGHNYKNGFAFGKLDRIQIGDEIIVGGERYTVFDIFIVSADEIGEVISQATNNQRWVTLFTCTYTDNGKERLVVRAKNNCNP
jgi:sortase A